MAGVSSNLPEIDKVFRDLADTFDFTRPGRQQSLGRDALAAVTTAIGDRCRREEAPGGDRWAENKEWAKKDPRKRGKPIGVLGDQDNMLSPAELAGEQEITKDSAIATYGITDENQQKMEWFSEGNSNQAARPTYEMDAETDAALEAVLDEELDRWLEGI